MRKKLFTFLLALVTSVGLSYAAVDGKLPGVFSVSADKAVSFSKGNLQYTKSTGKWSFMEHQYDVVETYEQNVGNDYADQDVVGLFGWGTSGNSESGTNYQPYCTSTTNVDYVSYLTEAGEWTASKSDWGVVNSGDLGEGWRVMTKDEWCYLLGWTSAKRDNASNLRTFATVNGMKGLILMPDGWTASGVSLTVTTSNFTTNNINTTDWATLEEQGCVFLPAAGCRNGSPLVNSVGFWGYYWYSTAESSIDVYRLGFSSEGLRPINYFPRNYGLSVRLVTETTPPGSDEPEEEGDVIILQTNTQQSSYTQSTVTITCNNVGDNDGFTIGTPSGYTATITNSGSSTISKIVLVPGYYKSNHPYVRANGAQPTSSSNDLITFTNVNSNSVTLSMSTTNNFQIKEVRVTLVGGGSTPTPANVCGDGLTWELNGGVLTISYDGVGTGEMTDFGYEYDASPVNVAPWKENKSAITTVIVGDGVKSIGNYAFNDLTENFTAVTIANSVERIGVFAFTNSEEITAITLPSSLKTIDDQGFANCGFTSITIPSGVTSIGYKAFSWCRKLTSLTCEATTPPTLDESVFYKISNTSSIPLYVPSASVTAYEAAAQWNAFNIQGYDPTPHPHGECGAQGDNLLWEFNPATGTLTITGSGAMPTIWDTPASVSWHEYRADITSVSLPDGLTTIGGYAFYSCPGLTSVTIPENVTNIAIAAFANCANLASVTLPNSVLSIGQSALALCPSMTSLTLGSGLSSIGTAAFSGCSGLESVTNYATTPQVLDSYAFYNVEISNCELYVPEESVAAYQAATTWKDFKNVQAIGPAPTPTEEQIPTNADPENPSYRYSTFFHSTQNYKLSNDGTQAFIADLSNNELVLTEIAHGEQVIPANTAVILRKTGSADPVVLIPTQENGVIINPDDNSLRGVDEETTLVSLSINPLQCYVLSGKSHDETESGVGFYLIYGNSLRAHKAYVIFAGGSNNAPKKMRFVYGQATGIEDVQGNNVQSTKVIENGVLYIIRDGKTYNAMGQMVK